MKTVEDFVNQLVRIEYIEQSKSFGHYPFQMVVETKDGKLELYALALERSESYYLQAGKHVKEKAKKIFLSMDFPPGGDIKNDFIAVFSIVDRKVEVFAIPYDSSTGESLPIRKESQLLNQISNQFIVFAFGGNLG